MKSIYQKIAFLSVPALFVGIGFFLDHPISMAQDHETEEVQEIAQSAALAAPATAKPRTDSSSELIATATNFAKQSRFADGISLLKLIHPEDSGYSTAQQLNEQWVDEILQRGKAKIQQGKPQQGLAILRSIPSDDLPAEAVTLLAQAQPTGNSSTRWSGSR